MADLMQKPSDTESPRPIKKPKRKDSPELLNEQLEQFKAVIDSMESEKHKTKSPKSSTPAEDTKPGIYTSTLQHIIQAPKKPARTLEIH